MCDSLDHLFAHLPPPPFLLIHVLEYVVFTLFSKGPRTENAEWERPVLGIEFQKFGL